MTCRLGSISDSNRHIIPVSVDRNADQLEPTRFENYSLADAADKKRRDLIYSQLAGRGDQTTRELANENQRKSLLRKIVLLSLKFYKYLELKISLSRATPRVSSSM
ncbi:hypothetical protein AVEN_7869-1 [Araneus ventricosus]|uniref:Uncharacterized protein n=1 Tax=Araneus ventricosus TaxID=182803 RepID=A0A4Y2MGB2_ARAVE|nr:hypothetical protein AVEN_7869-1 [Araneus ventricosus]